MKSISSFSSIDVLATLAILNAKSQSGNCFQEHLVWGIWIPWGEGGGDIYQYKELNTFWASYHRPHTPVQLFLLWKNKKVSLSLNQEDVLVWPCIVPHSSWQTRKGSRRDQPKNTSLQSYSHWVYMPSILLPSAIDINI